MILPPGLYSRGSALDIGLKQSEVEEICKDEFDMNMSDFKKIIYIQDKIINFVG